MPIRIKYYLAFLLESLIFYYPIYLYGYWFSHSDLYFSTLFFGLSAFQLVYAV